MEIRSDWYNRIVKEINAYQGTLSKKEFKKYKLDLLVRVSRRVDDFSAICGECQMFQQEITGLTQGLGNLIQIPGKEERKSYFKTINDIIKHLQKQHKLVIKGQHIAMWSGIGVAVGMGLGAAIDNPGVGSGLGTAIGVGIGVYLDKKAQREDKVI